MKILVLQILLIPTICLAGGMTAKEAFKVGKEDANTAKNGMKSYLSAKSASESVPKYTNAPEEKKMFQGGQGNLGTYGLSKVTKCSTTVSANKYDQQECDVVNFFNGVHLNRKTFDLRSTDPLITTSKKYIASAKSIGKASTTCKAKQITTGAEYASEVCHVYGELQGQTCSIGTVIEVDKDAIYQCKEQKQSVIDSSCTIGRTVKVDADTNFQCVKTINAYENVTCSKRKVANASTYSADNGSEVPENTIKYYKITMNVSGNPYKFNLTYYRVDNYGQLYVNGTLVKQNMLWSGDYRGGKVALVNEGIIWRYHIFDNTGVDKGVLINDGCNSGCKGESLNQDITSYVKKGANTIELVCVNQTKIGPCQFKIDGISDYEITEINDCATLEQRAL